MRVRVYPLIVALLCGVAAWSAAVQVREEPLTLPYFYKESRPNPENPRRPLQETMRGKDVTYTSVVLENEYVRVQTIPELGGVVYRAIDKASGDDYFYYEGLGKDWYVFWESGIKNSFPKAEHSCLNFGQPASYRIYRHADGSVTLATWMDFSRHHEKNQTRRGRFSRLMLSQFVTVRPGEGFFSYTLRVTNPSPYKQGLRVWDDAFFPRNQTKDGAVQGFAAPPEKTLTELVYPVSHLSFHRGEQFRQWDDKEAKLGDITQMYNSYFAWDIPYGFCGLWYPEVQVNRLRLWDPKVAPGAKVYFEGEGTYNKHMLVKDNWQKEGLYDVLDCNYDFVEVWGGSENLFEDVENWIGPGETYEFTHDFTYVRGIGKVDYADTRVAVNVEFGARPVAELVTLRAAKVSATFDGKSLGTAPCAPNTPARFLLPAGVDKGRLVVKAGRAVLLDKVFPLEITENPAGYDRIRKALDRNRPEFAEMFADMPENGGPTYRNAIGRYPDGSVARGRVLYRDGQLDAAIACLQKAVAADAQAGEGWHLLGMALLEKGQTDEARTAFGKAISARDAAPQARYYLAVLALGQGDSKGASRELTALIKALPGHYEARLLLAWVRGDLAAARALEAQDPADPRVQAVMAHCAEKSKRTRKDADAARQLLERMEAQEPGAQARVEEFLAATQGKYLPPARLNGK